MQQKGYSMEAFKLIKSNMNMENVIAELDANDHLFGEFNARKEAQGSPHAEMQDILSRFE